MIKERESTKPLAGLIQLDDAFWGGQRRGKRGRGARGKTPMAATVATDEDGHPQRLRLNRVGGFRLREIARAGVRPISPRGSQVCSDGLSCFSAVSQAGCSHEPKVMSGPGSLPRKNNVPPRRIRG